MGYKFVVTGQIIPHEIGDEVEFDEMPPEGMLHRLKPVEGSELVVATPQAEPEGGEVIEAELTEQVKTAEVAEAEPEQAEPEAEKPKRGGR